MKRCRNDYSRDTSPEDVSFAVSGQAAGNDTSWPGQHNSARDR